MVSEGCLEACSGRHPRSSERISGLLSWVFRWRGRLGAPARGAPAADLARPARPLSCGPRCASRETMRNEPDSRGSTTTSTSTYRSLLGVVGGSCRHRWTEREKHSSVGPARGRRHRRRFGACRTFWEGLIPAVGPIQPTGREGHVVILLTCVGTMRPARRWWSTVKMSYGLSMYLARSSFHQKARTFIFTQALFFFV